MNGDGAATNLFDHVLVPVASESDADATCSALLDHLPSVGRVTAVHVVEKASGAPDKAPLAKRRNDGKDLLSRVESRLEGRVPVTTRLTYATNVVDALFDIAEEVDASAIVFRPRGGSRLLQLLTGDTATKIVTESEMPVVSLPDPE